jgi:hypothetical protein
MSASLRQLAAVDITPVGQRQAPLVHYCVYSIAISVPPTETTPDQPAAIRKRRDEFRRCGAAWMLGQCGNKATMASLNHDVISRIPLLVPAKPILTEFRSFASDCLTQIANPR